MEYKRAVKKTAEKRTLGNKWFGQEKKSFCCAYEGGIASYRINLPNPVVINGKGNFVGHQRKVIASPTHLYPKTLDCISISQQLIAGWIPMTDSIIESAGVQL